MARALGRTGEAIGPRASCCQSLEPRYVDVGVPRGAAYPEEDPVDLTLSVESELESVHPSSHIARFVVTVMATRRARPAPIDLVLAIDRSSSMRGAPIDSALRAARLLVEALGDEDHLAIVVFDRTAQTLVPRTSTTKEGRAALRDALGTVVVGRGTNIEAALRASFALTGDAHAAVLLLSDGVPAVGLRRVDALSGVVRERRGHTTLSVVGVGSGTDPVLLHELARVGRGRYSHLAGDGDATQLLGAEFGVLRATSTGPLSFTLRTRPGVDVVDMVTPVKGAIVDGRTTWEPSPLSSEPVHFVFDLTFPRLDARGEARELAMVELTTTDLEGHRVVREARVLLEVNLTPGRPRPDAVVHIVKATAARALFSLSRSPQPSARYAEFAELIATIERRAAEVGVRAHPEVETTLSVLQEVLTHLSDRTDEMQHKLVALAEEAQSTRRAMFDPRREQARPLNQEQFEGASIVVPNLPRSAGRPPR